VILRPPRDVLYRAIAVLGVHRDLLLVIAGKHAMRRLHLDPRDHWVFGITHRAARSDPAADQAIFVGADLQPLAAAVGDLPRRLLQEQALIGGGREDSSSARFFYQSSVIDLRLEAEQR